MMQENWPGSVTPTQVTDKRTQVLIHKSINNKSYSYKKLTQNNLSQAELATYVLRNSLSLEARAIHQRLYSLAIVWVMDITLRRLRKKTQRRRGFLWSLRTKNVFFFNAKVTTVSKQNNVNRRLWQCHI